MHEKENLRESSVRGNICLLEDDKDIADILQYFLAEEGYHLDSYNSILDFNTRLLNSQTDLFLLDMRLPDGYGLDVCKMLKADLVTYNVPVLIMSAGIYTDDFFEIADGFIAKPFDLEELLLKVESHIQPH
ncbi:response regulator transcription factor [Pedobacter sp. MC2016-24]|uniref:response regulator transcription factor n=1 Tax=Pedobacter sp. MC2016-24 TaxID=2780090 RepID=UPI00187E2689|nr:response regulator [Pedobacter sp. MC2016-24]MBE9601487.1 response regulator transcription factor [Pedobacter sp. MC2016-24]